MGLTKKHVLITCGPTWVAIDPVRVISNHSSGELGQNIARDFKSAGAQITLLEGPVHNPLKSKNLKIIKFRFYDEFLQKFKVELRKKVAVVIHAAAVADYRPKRELKSKLPSGQKQLKLTLIPTKKIINQIRGICPDTFLVGFKLEHSNDKNVLLKKAKRLMKSARCDLVVANSLYNEYRGYIVGKGPRVLAQARSRKELSAKLLQIVRERL